MVKGQGIGNADITVTTATRSEAAVRQDLGATGGAKPAEKPAEKPGEKPADSAVDDKKPAGEVTPELEADSTKPDAEVSAAARTLRQSRADARKAKIQDEINDLTRTRHSTRAEVETARRELAQLRQELVDLKTPPAERKPAGAVPGKPAARDAAPTFSFPTHEQYQAEHPDASWDEYADARSDARYEFNRSNERAEAAREAERTAQREAFTSATAHEAAFKIDHPDYDTKLAAFELPGVEVVDGQVVRATAQYLGVQRLLLRAGKDAPAILYFLADHHDDATRLLTASDPAALLETFGEIKYAAKAALATPPAAPAARAGEPAPPVEAPPKPRTSAPAPLTPVPGASSHTRTLQQVAEDDDDADAYIATRRQQQRRTG